MNAQWRDGIKLELDSPRWVYAYYRHAFTRYSLAHNIRSSASVPDLDDLHVTSIICQASDHRTYTIVISWLPFYHFSPLATEFRTLKSG